MGSSPWRLQKRKHIKQDKLRKNKKNKEEKNRNISDKLSKAKRASGYKAAKAPPKKKELTKWERFR